MVENGEESSFGIYSIFLSCTYWNDMSNACRYAYIVLHSNPSIFDHTSFDPVLLSFPCLFQHSLKISI